MCPTNIQNKLKLISFHFIREKVLNKDISLQFISTRDQLADIFTKDLTCWFHHSLFYFLHPFACGGNINHITDLNNSTSDSSHNITTSVASVNIVIHKHGLILSMYINSVNQ
jgi:hypothetical protein